MRILNLSFFVRPSGFGRPQWPASPIPGGLFLSVMIIDNKPYFYSIYFWDEFEWSGAASKGDLILDGIWVIFYQSDGNR